MDGVLIIGTDLKTDKFDKKIEKLEQKYKKQEVALEIKSDSIDEAKRKLDEYSNKLRQTAKQQEEVASKLKSKKIQYGAIEEKINAGQAVSTADYEMYGKLSNDIADLTYQQQALTKEQDKYNNLTTKAYDNVVKMEKQQALLKDEIAQTNIEIQRTNLERQQQQTNDIKNNINETGNSISGVVKKVTKWGLAIFGIRSMYLGIRQAVNQLLATDENLKYQIDYMKWSIGQAIKPIVEWLVNAVHQLLVWIGAIIKILFGINIFAGATANNFKKANSQAQKLQRTLAGFDEMNILNKNGTTGALGAIDNALKGFDLAKEVDDLAEKLKPFENEIKTIAILAAGIFGASVIAKWMGNIGTLMGAGGLGGLGSMLGTLAIIAGGIIITTIVAKKVWEEARQLEQDMKKIAEENGKAQEKWIDNEEDINKLIGTGNTNRKYGLELIKDSHSWLSKLLQLDKQQLETAKQTAINIGKQIDKEVELYNKGKLTKEEQDKVKQNIIDQISYNKILIANLEEQGMDTAKIKEENKRLSTELYAVGNNIKWSKSMTEQWALENDKVKVGYDGTVEVLKDINNMDIKDKNATVEFVADTSKVESALSKLGKAVVTAGIELSNQVKKTFNMNAKGAIYYPPKLAVGGIINRPGRGIPIGSAIGGEKGAEGVIPLTDSQQMSMLGEAIGRYINVHITNVTELDGRTIARKVQEVNNKNNFLMNR